MADRDGVDLDLDLPCRRGGEQDLFDHERCVELVAYGRFDGLHVPSCTHAAQVIPFTPHRKREYT